MRQTMRVLLSIMSLIIAVQTFGQHKEVKLKLTENVVLTLVKDTFDPKGKNVEMSDNVVISIDHKLVFGTDGEVPRTYLKKATLTIGTKSYDLQVDGMYDPWLEDYFNEKVFSLNSEGPKYRIRGIFSDGAGSYAAEWVVYGQGSIRTILTDDEKLLFEYMDK
jgi:hypothetical protein